MKKLILLLSCRYVKQLKIMKYLIFTISFFLCNNLFSQFSNPLNSFSNRDFSKNYKVETTSFIITSPNEIYSFVVPENSFVVMSGHRSISGAHLISINGSNFFGSPEDLIFAPNYEVSIKNDSSIPFAISLIEFKADETVSNNIIHYAGVESFLFMDDLNEVYTIPEGFYLELIIDYYNSNIYVNGQSISSVGVGTVIPENFTIQRGSSTLEFRDRPIYGILIPYDISSLSFSENDFNQLKLFPNPTTTEVALNSEKDYKIEVFDLLGNKVMELTGNTINMKYLSNATYIVNALDLETQETLSYKIVKE